MVTYQLHIGDAPSDTIIFASIFKEMDLCLNNLGFVIDESGHYELIKGDIIYWVIPFTAVHVAYLKEKL